ncbi:MAG: ABC transporter permease [Firmicutes bacterium]|nr:ABC transporter permease [Bacillota bacterium]
MNKLIQNEWIKLLHRKGIVLLILLAFLSAALCVGIVSYSDSQKDNWQQTYLDEIDKYNRQLIRYSEFDANEWENETSYRADLMRWQNKIQLNQFCLDNKIPDWDWRIEILNQYFQNLLLLDCVRSGWNAEDLDKYFGFSNDINLANIEEENKSLMVYVQNNDYQTYNKDLLQRSEQYLMQLNELQWVEDAAKTKSLATNDVEMWERYVNYNVPPAAKDNWTSLAIQHIHDNTAELIKLQNLSPEDELSQPERREELEDSIAILEASIAKDSFALEYEMPSEALLREEYHTRSNSLNYMQTAFTAARIVIVLLGIILAAVSIGAEYRQDTLQQLVIYPYKRKKILHAKYLTVEGMLLLICLLLAFIHLAIGYFVYPMDKTFPVYFMSWQNNTVYWVPYLAYVGIRYLLILLEAYVMIALTAALAVISHSIAVSSIITTLAYFLLPGVLELVYRNLDRPAVLNYLLFGNLNLTNYLTNAGGFPYTTVLISLAIVLGAWFIFKRISYIVFRCSEIRES